MSIKTIVRTMTTQQGQCSPILDKVIMQACRFSQLQRLCHLCCVAAVAELGLLHDTQASARCLP